MDERLARLAARQGGAVTRGQAVALGESYATVAGRLRRGEWREAARGALRVAGAPEDARSRLWVAQLAVGPPLAVTGLAAARGHGIAGLPERGPVRILVPASRRPDAPPGVVVARVAAAELAGVRVVGGHPLTSVPVTLRWLSRDVPGDVLEDAVAEALLRRLTTLDRLRAALGRGRTGSAALRAALSRLGDGYESRAERELARWIRARGLPPPVRQATLRGPDGAVHRPDFLWWPARLGVEVDGWAVHGTRAAFAADRRRANRVLVEHGVTLLRYPATRVRDEPAAVVAEIARALARRATPSPTATPPGDHWWPGTPIARVPCQ